MEDITYIRYLIIREHLGRINPEERALLYQCLEDSEEARNVQKEIQAIPREEFINLTRDISVDAGLESILQRERDFKRRRLNLRLRVATGISVAALVAWGFFSFIIKEQNNSPSSFSAGTKEATGNAATLTLANGKVISLNDSGYQQVLTGNTDVKNNNRSLNFRHASAESAIEGWNTLTVPTKLDYQVELSDGTTVWLNSTTKFRFPFSFSNKTREVYLDEGEAYFKVAQHSNQPFVVHTGHGDVEVLGTEFNINTYNNKKVITSLVQGKVAVKIENNRKELKPGLEASLEAGKAILVKDFDPSITLSWRQGVHYFNDAPITAVAIMLERWFDTPLIIDNPEVGNVLFRGRLNRRKPLQNFIEQMNLTMDVTFYWLDGKLHCK